MAAFRVPVMISLNTFGLSTACIFLISLSIAISTCKAAPTPAVLPATQDEGSLLALDMKEGKVNATTASFTVTAKYPTLSQVGSWVTLIDSLLLKEESSTCL